MRKEKLFHSHEEYQNFIHEIEDYMPISGHPELEPYRHNIKMIYDYKNLINPTITDYPPLIDDQIDTLVAFVKELVDTKINDRVMKTIHDSLYPDFNGLLDGVAVIVKPSIIVNEDLNKYLKLCRKLFFKSHYCWLWEINTGNPDLDRIYSYLKDIYFDAEHKYNSFVHTYMMDFVFGALHYYDMSSKENIDYIVNLMKDKLFQERLKIMDCVPLDCLGNCQDGKTRYVLDNFMDIFQEHNISIR